MSDPRGPLKTKALGDAFAQAFKKNLGQGLLANARARCDRRRQELVAQLKAAGYPEDSFYFSMDLARGQVSVHFHADKIPEAL